MKKNLGTFAILAVLLTNNSMANEESQFRHLASYSRMLSQLQVQYIDYVPTLSRYANSQGFNQPYENLATTVHELIHIASAHHSGYFIDGNYYEPYVDSRYWPALKNREVLPGIREHEKGVMVSLYMRSTPDNNLGNVLDEINAYSHVAPFVCQHESQSAEKQVRNLTGLLHIVEAYLRATKALPNEAYTRLVTNPVSSGALATIVTNAWRALMACGVDRRMIPQHEASAFINDPRRLAARQ